MKNKVKLGYTRTSGHNKCSSSLMRRKNRRTRDASTMPNTPQRIQEGKNDPRILKVGAREHPAGSTTSASAVPARAARCRTRVGGEGKFVINFPVRSCSLVLKLMAPWY